MGKEMVQLSEIMNTYCYWFIDENGDKWLLARTNDTWYYVLPDGKGDLAFRMAIIALFTGDPKIIKACIKLLNGRERWPDGLKNKYDAKNQLDYLIHKMLRKLKIKPLMKYNSQGRMSRDPFTMLTCAIYWHQYEMIQDLKIPWYINRAPLRNWKKYLETNDLKYKTKYEKAAIRNINFSLAFGYHGYVKFLNAWMAFIARSEVVKAKILPFVPEWNVCVRMLCGEQLDECCQDIRPRDGFIWDYGGSTLPKDDRFLGTDEPIFVDTGILQFVHENQDWK